MNVRRHMLALALVALCTPALATAQLADLSVSVVGPEWTGETTASFAVTVTNVSSVAYSHMGDPIDVSFFQHSATQPESGNSIATDTDVLAEFIGPGESKMYIFEHDYQAASTYTAWFFVDSFGIALGELGIEGGAPEEPKTNNVVSETFVLSFGEELADLVLANFTANVVGSQKVIFQATVQNVGAVFAPDGFKIDILYDPPGGNCPPDGWKTVPSTLFGDKFATVAGGVGAGESKDVPPIEGNPGPGLHKACAMLDVDNVVPEIDETGNNVFGPVEFVLDDAPDPPACDLDISKWKVTTLGPVVTYDVCVTNVGDAPCGPHTVDLWYHSATTPAPGAQPTSHVWVVNSLPVGDEWCGKHEQDPPPPNGGYMAWVWADPVNVTKDKFPDNNLEEAYPYTVLSDTDCADLTVVDVEWVQVADQLHFDVTVRNKGVKAAQNVPVNIFFSFETNPNCFSDDLSNAPLEEVVLDELPAGAQETLSFIWDAPTPGEHSAWVKIACLGELDECDQTNNDFGPVQTEYIFTPTEGVDLELVTFQSFGNCTNVNYTVTIRNRGDEPAPPFATAIYHHRETNPNFADSNWDFVCYVPQDPEETDKSLWLQPGGVTECQYTFEEAPNGTYKSWAVIDPGNQLSEEDGEGLAEGNNITWVDFTVDHDACRCPENTLIEDTCACGTVTVTEGYCCFDQWQFEPFEQCVGNPEGDNPNNDAGNTGGDMGTNNGDAVGGDVNGASGQGVQVSLDGSRDTTLSDGDCSAGGSGNPHTLLLILLVVAALLVSRRRLQPRRKPLRLDKRRQ